MSIGVLDLPTTNVRRCSKIAFFFVYKRSLQFISTEREREAKRQKIVCKIIKTKRRSGMKRKKEKKDRTVDFIQENRSVMHKSDERSTDDSYDRYQRWHREQSTVEIANPRDRSDDAGNVLPVPRRTTRVRVLAGRNYVAGGRRKRALGRRPVRPAFRGPDCSRYSSDRLDAFGRDAFEIRTVPPVLFSGVSCKTFLVFIHNVGYGTTWLFDGFQ